MKKILSLILAALMLCTMFVIAVPAAGADGQTGPEIIAGAAVLPEGHRMSSITITYAEDIEDFNAENLKFYSGRNMQETECEAVTDGASITVSFSPVSPTSAFEITYEGVINGVSGAVLADNPTYTLDDLDAVNTAIADDFTEGTYTSYYYDESGVLCEMTIPYRLYIPENAGSSEPLPLVFTLHGSGEAGNDNFKHITANQIATCWADPEWQAENPCYVLSPQWPDSSYSNDPYMLDVCIGILHQLARDVIDRYNVDETRVYAATLSMGSRMITRFMERYPEMFVSALVVCGNAVAADLTHLTQPAIWFLHAENDPVNKVEGSINAYNDCVAAGNQHVKLTIFTTEEMNGLFGHASWQLVYGHREYMDWLFSWQADGIRAEAPESAETGEEFIIDAYLDDAYTAVKLVNENGRNISIKALNIEDGEYLNNWNISTSIGTAGEAREISVMAKKSGGEYELIGTVAMDIVQAQESTGARAAVEKAEFASDTVQAGETVAIEVTSNLLASRIKIVNENDGNMGKNLVSVAYDGNQMLWTYEMSIGTPGARVFTAMAAKEDGVFNTSDVGLASITVE